MTALRGAARGAAAGLAATAAMTAVMGGLRPFTRGDLGPRQVTGWLLGHLDPATVGRRAPVGLSLVNHAAYGSALGAVYGALFSGSHRAGVRSGLPYALMVWASNYGALLPALGVLPAPDEDDTSHAVRVHLAHWAYGAVLGTLVRHRPNWRNTHARQGGAARHPRPLAEEGAADVDQGP